MSNEPACYVPARAHRSGWPWWALLLTMAAVDAGAQTVTIHGRVVDHGTGRAIEGASIRVTGNDRILSTDAAGRFLLADLDTGAVRLTTSMIGYGERDDTLQFRRPAIVDLEIRLSAKPVELPAIVAVARSPRLIDAGFFERRNEGYNGYFFTREDIERSQPREMTDLIQRIPGTLIRYGEPGRRIIHFRRWPGDVRRATDRNADYGCVPDLYLDGMRMRDRIVDDAYTPRLDDYNVVPPPAIEAIEVYIGANSPMQYKHPCGVVLVWTRRGGTG